MTILCALLILFVAILVTTITSLYDHTIQLFIIYKDPQHTLAVFLSSLHIIPYTMEGPWQGVTPMIPSISN